MATTRGAPLAASMWMIDRVHGDAPYFRTLAKPARTAGFSQGDVLMVKVANLPDCSIATLQNHTHFTGRKFDLRIFAFLGHQLSIGPGAPRKLAAFS